jgi:hypothetical protein
MHNRLTPRLVLCAFFSFALIVSTVSSIPAVHAVPGSAGSVEFLNQTGMITSTGAVTPSGTNDFTHEMWIKPTVTNLGEAVLFTTATNRRRENSTTLGNCNSLTLLISGGKVGYTFGHWRANNVAPLTGTLSSGAYISSDVLTAAWHHIALTQTSNVIKLWVDGVTVASSGNITVDSTCATATGKADYSTTPIIFSNTALYFGEWYSGRISDYRYTRLSARYTSTFTPPIEALTSANSNEWLVPFDYTINGTYELINNGVTTTPFTVAPPGSGPTGNGNIVAGSVVSREFTPYAKFTPTFTWSNVSKNVGDASFSLAAPTPSTPGTFTYSSATTSVISLSGTTATIGSAGTSVITATFTPTNTVDYNSTTTTMTITVIGSGQTINFGVISDKIISDTPPVLSATATSGLTVAFTSATTGVCTVSGTSVTFVGPGTCTINANQAGNGTYAAAPQVQRSFAIAYLTQSISFDALTGATLGVSSAPLIKASASSGLGVAYSSITPGVCSVSGTTITMLNPGTCTISASQAGNGTYSAAATINQSFAITAKPDDGQKELLAILALIPSIGELALSLGETTQSLYKQKCVKGKLVKYVKSGAKCPKGYAVYKKKKVTGS